jgi:hypothetical protein
MQIRELRRSENGPELLNFHNEAASSTPDRGACLSLSYCLSLDLRQSREQKIDKDKDLGVDYSIG